MLQTFVNAWKVADLRKKMLYTALIVLIFRIGSAIPVPFTDIAREGVLGDGTAAFMNAENSFLNYLNMIFEVCGSIYHKAYLGNVVNTAYVVENIFQFTFQSNQINRNSSIGYIDHGFKYSFVLFKIEIIRF